MFERRVGHTCRQLARQLRACKSTRIILERSHDYQDLLPRKLFLEEPPLPLGLGSNSGRGRQPAAGSPESRFDLSLAAWLVDPGAMVLKRKRIKEVVRKMGATRRGRPKMLGGEIELARRQTFGVQ